MTVWLFVGLALAGGAGAALRFLLDGAIKQSVSVAYPLGTTIINVSGSLVLGFLTGLTGHGLLPMSWQLILGTGLLGGYTTFSTASFETVRLVQEGRWLAGTLNGIGMLAGAVAAAALGLWLGHLA